MRVLATPKQCGRRFDDTWYCEPKRGAYLGDTQAWADTFLPKHHYRRPQVLAHIQQYGQMIESSSAGSVLGYHFKITQDMPAFKFCYMACHVPPHWASAKQVVANLIIPAQSDVILTCPNALALPVDGFTRPVYKCRSNRVWVESLVDMDGYAISHARSWHDPSYLYFPQAWAVPGSPLSFDLGRPCRDGIHFWIDGAGMGLAPSGQW